MDFRRARIYRPPRLLARSWYCSLRGRSGEVFSLKSGRCRAVDCRGKASTRSTFRFRAARSSRSGNDNSRAGFPFSERERSDGIRLSAAALSSPATADARRHGKYGSDTGSRRDDHKGSSRPAGKRAGQPAELATTYVMLADPLSSYVSGATVAVTGGRPFL